MIRRITEVVRRALERLEPEEPKAQSWVGTLNECQTMRGRLTFRNASSLRAALFALLNQRRNVLGLNCARVDFCDGAAIAAILEFAMACKHQGTRLFFMNPSESLSNAFRLYGLGSMLDALSTHGPVIPASQGVELGDENLVILVEEDFPESIRIAPVGEAA